MIVVAFGLLTVVFLTAAVGATGAAGVVGVAGAGVYPAHVQFPIL